MQKDQLIALLDEQIKIIHEELDEVLGLRIAGQRAYRKGRFLECLRDLVIENFKPVNGLDNATVEPIDLAKKIWLGITYDQPGANRNLRTKILSKYRDDFENIADTVSSRLSSLGFDAVIYPFTDDRTGSNRYGIKLQPIKLMPTSNEIATVSQNEADSGGLRNADLSEDEFTNSVGLMPTAIGMDSSSQTDKFSGSLQNPDLSSKEIIQYEEIELPKSVWPRRIRSTKFKLEMISAFFFFAALIPTAYFYVFAMQKSPNLLLVGLSGLTMYFFIAVMFFIARAAYYREFSAPVFMWRRAANIPAVIVTPEKVGGREKSRLIEIKNIIGRCPVCLANGYPEDEAVVYLKPKFGSIKGRLEGVCSISDRHIYDYDSVTNKGCRQKVS